MAEGPSGLGSPSLQSQSLDQPRTQPVTQRKEAWLPLSALGQEGACGQAILEVG